MQYEPSALCSVGLSRRAQASERSPSLTPTITFKQNRKAQHLLADIPTSMTQVEFLVELAAFLRLPECQELLAVHPNQATLPGFCCPGTWRSWWAWAAEPTSSPYSKWERLWRYYVAPQSNSEDFTQIPAELRKFVDDARRLQLVRDPRQEASPPGDSLQTPITIPLPKSSSPPECSVKLQGMSPKKAHEVRCMTTYTSQLLASISQQGVHTQHVVDIGAGQRRLNDLVQAYISRTLRDELGVEVLAVDWNPDQADGAARREAAAQKDFRDTSRTGLTYKTLTINKDSLLAITDEWAAQLVSSGAVPSPGRPAEPLRVLLLALHACGSLTIDVLRAFCEQARNPEPVTWKPVAALVVGCCYNLLRTEDWISLTGRDVVLSANHLQLAAQVPRHWDRTPAAFGDAKLAIRKVAWRALLEGVLARESQARTGRLGRLNDAAYRTWETFLAAAEKKLGVKLGGCARDRAMESRLEVFQLLRCVIGPVVESFLLLDRKVWLERELQDTSYAVGLVNLFDQKKDSARNVAIVITPSLGRASGSSSVRA